MTNPVHRPYSRVRGSEPSVTTILSLLPKPGIEWAATRECATFAVLHPEKWEHLAPVQAIDLLRKHHRGIWNGRAAMGTLAHLVNQRFVDGQDVDIEKLVEETIDSDRNAKTWADQDRDELIEQALGYVLGIERWWADFRPSALVSEVCVRWPGLYVGQTDLRCTIDTTWPNDFSGPQDTLIDLKTTAKQDEGSGVYVDSWLFQLTAYGMARETVSYALGGTGRIVEDGTAPWSRPQRYAVLHLRGDERYAFYEVPVLREHERTVLRLARAYRTINSVPTELARVQPLAQVAVA